MQINDLKTIEQIIFRKEVNFYKVQLNTIDGSFYYCENILLENLVDFDSLELLYLNPLTGLPESYLIEIFEDGNNKEYGEEFKELLNYYHLIDCNNIINFGNLLS